MTAKYPDVTVRLSDQDGNAMSIIARVRKALHRAGVNDSEIDTFTTEAMAGDYDHVLQTCIKWVDVS